MLLLQLHVLTLASLVSPPLPRVLIAENGHFVNPTTREVVLMVGTNVVVKGPPFLPDASGTVGCADKPNCDDMHNCTATCTTFNARDAATLKTQGYNFIRLGVVWAGGQPDGPGPLDPTFQAKLLAIL